MKHNLHLHRSSGGGGASLKSAIDGAVAASIATLAVYPFDLLRTRVALGHAQLRWQRGPATLEALMQVIKREGPWGLYRGIGPSLGQIVPSMAIAFGTYETAHQWMMLMVQWPLPSSLVDLLAGGLAGLVQKTMMMPVDVVRKGLQIQGSPYHHYVLSDLPVYRGFMDAVGQIWRCDGFLGFYRGLGLALLKSIPVTATTFLIYGLMDRL